MTNWNEYIGTWDLLNKEQLDATYHHIPLVTALLLYLRWADFQEAEQEAIAAFNGEDYTPVLNSSLHWRSWHNLPSKELKVVLWEQLPKALMGLGNNRMNPLATQLHRLAAPIEVLKKLPGSILGMLINHLSAYPFETIKDRQNLLSDFDELLNFKFDKYQGEHFTPSHIAKLMVELAAPARGERIYDPCFGSANFLTEACKYIQSNDPEVFSRPEVSALKISGVEINNNAYVIGLLRLALAGVADPLLELGNSLERTSPDNPQRDGFDLVFANPPWGMRDHSSGLDHYPIRTHDSTGLFVQHILSQLKPEGRAILVVPQGFLFRHGVEQKLRRYIIENHKVEAVVALPQMAFMPYTAVHSSVLVLRRKGPTKVVRMVDAETFFEQGKGKKPATIRGALARNLADRVKSPEASKHCWDVTADAIAEIGWDLSAHRRDQSDLIQSLEAIQAKVEILLLDECCKILGGRHIKAQNLSDTSPEKKLKDEALPYIRIADIQNQRFTSPTSWLVDQVVISEEKKWKLRAGDILLSKSGTIGKVAVVSNGAVGGVASSGLFVLQVDKDRLDPHFLVAYLNSFDCKAWLNDHARGAAIQHLPKTILNKLKVPLPPLQMQQNLAEDHHKYGTDLLQSLTKLLLEAEGDPVSEWIDKAITLIPSRLENGATAATLAPIESLASELNNYRNEFVHSKNERFSWRDIKGKEWPNISSSSKTIGSGVGAIVAPIVLGALAGPVGAGIGAAASSVFLSRFKSWSKKDVNNSLINWMAIYIKSIMPLKGISSIPVGPSFLSLLQESSQGLRDSEAWLDQNLPQAKKAKQLNASTLKRIERVIAHLLETAEISFNISTVDLIASETSEIDLKVVNLSPLPLREVQISTDPEWGGAELEYFPEKGVKEIVLKAIVPNTPGIFPLNISWVAKTLDGEVVQGQRELALNILEKISSELHVAVDFGGSPYITGGEPVRRERQDVFFGREVLIDQICRQIVTSGNVVLLEGVRRAGKSSILWHLEGRDFVPGWLGAYVSFQGIDGTSSGVGVPTVAVFRGMAESIAKAIHSLGVDTPLPTGGFLPASKKIGIARACREGISEESPFSDFREYIETSLDTLKDNNLKLLLLIDEVDKLQDGIAKGVTSPQIPENIRFLVQSYPGVSAILTGSRRLKRLREEYWSVFYGLGTRFDVSALSDKAARNLVADPVKDRFLYSKEAVERIIYLTAKQPYLLQCLCNRVFDMAARQNIRSVTLDHVNDAADTFIDDNEHFASLWSYAGSDRRRFILALIHRASSGPDALYLAVLNELLSEHGVEIGDKDLVSDLEFLRELEMVHLSGNKKGGGCYELTIPLLGMWIDLQQDFVALEIKAKNETEEKRDR